MLRLSSPVMVNDWPVDPFENEPWEPLNFLVQALETQEAIFENDNIGGNDDIPTP